MVDFLKDKYINPYTDFGFKCLFGTEANKALLISFHNALLPDEDVEQRRPRQQPHKSLTKTFRRRVETTLHRPSTMPSNAATPSAR